MNKNLLGLLFALPFVAMQINAATQVTEVSLGNSDTHAQDTLTLATNDANTITSKLAIIAQLNTELMELEVQAKDAVERTAELHPNHPARKAALAFEALVKQATDAVATMHKAVAQAIQAARTVTDNAAQKSKKNNQMALESLTSFKNALAQVRNPKEGIAA